ncbi:hypothetical protein L484_025701 [Morus notabilis]|uniref:Mediator of RNA polymerase II transcription subunit 15a n=1 Tax=Morus notabilis TaxID=981085 RepID=W9R3V6_9ROSA|nr:hypothetical protein L484_025701 [Morus notabilis]
MEAMKLIPETTENERDIEAMELYLPRLNLAYQKLTAKLQQLDSLPQQQKPEHYEKLKSLETKFERAMSCLQVPENSVSFCPGLVEKLAHFERQLKKLFSVNRRREPVSQLHQGQVPPSHMQTMQLPQSQITRVRFHENQMNPQLPSMHAQGSTETMQQNNSASLQETFISALSVEFQDLCLI